VSAEVFLSPKMPQVSRQGFLLCENHQAGYDSRWHLHDCAMLLWPRVGELRAAWLPDADRPEATSSAVLRRGTAMLLPAHAQHRTRGETRTHAHGELYLAHELLAPGWAAGVHQLDRAAVAMLDALAASAIRSDAAEHLVRAIVQQCSSAPRMACPTAPESVVQQMLRFIADALDREEGPPTIREVARRMGMSPRTLERHCEAQATASPVALRRALLAAHARARLREGDSLAQVSRRLNFANSGHLSRLLKQIAE
jgi:AraC-like DNA-binding protein